MSEEGKPERDLGSILLPEKPKAVQPLLSLGGPVINQRECRAQLKILHPATLVSAQVTAIIDTGATRSAISGPLAAKLGLPIVDSAMVSTANGTVKAHVVAAQFELVNLEGKPFSTIKRLTVANMVGEMLFGMDLLSGGVLTVDMVHYSWEWRLLATRSGGAPPKGTY